MEIWKDVIEYRGSYQVSNWGNVKNTKTNRIRRPTKDKDGYLRIQLGGRKDRKSKSIHRLVADVFIENPFAKPEVNHIDGNKENNNVNNLEWVTGEENRSHAIESGLVSSDSRPRPVIGENIKTGEVVFFKSTKAAARKYGTDVMNIKGACNGKRKTAVGFRWEYSIINIPGESQGEIYGLETESS